MGVNTGISVSAGLPMVGGGMSYAVLGSVLPTDASTALAVAYKRLGPISREGVRPAPSTNIEKVPEWDGSTLAALLTEESRSFEVTLYGVYDSDVNAYLFGTNATVSGMNTSDATASMMWRIRSRLSDDAVISRNVSSSAPSSL